jgi:hypothetical protein
LAGAGAAALAGAENVEGLNEGPADDDGCALALGVAAVQLRRPPSSVDVGPRLVSDIRQAACAFQTFQRAHRYATPLRLSRDL